MNKIIQDLKKYILVDGFHVVVDLEKSEGSWIRDAETGDLYLDCYSQFASQALGWNYLPYLRKDLTTLHKISTVKLANSDMYSEVFRDFVEAFASITPDFQHYFFIEGGSLAVENALKAAFDWKCQIDPECAAKDGQDLDVVHLKEAFHGRSGYTLSLTNTGDIKTKWFPKFPWSRILNPKIMPDIRLTEDMEIMALSELEVILKKRKTAAIIFETIQGEGGDNHFRRNFFKEVRKFADHYDAMFILDEVQCGMGLTGQWWAYEHYDAKPDMICFGKKAQVCGFCSNDRINSVPNNVFKQSGRINSTWGGNFVDMARCSLIIDVIKERDLLTHVKKVGDYFLVKLKELESKEVTNVRGKGFMLAFDLPDVGRRDDIIDKMHNAGLLALKCGEKSVRFRPTLTFSEQDVDDAIYFTKKALAN